MEEEDEEKEEVWERQRLRRRGVEKKVNLKGLEKKEKGEKTTKGK